MFSSLDHYEIAEIEVIVNTFPLCSLNFWAPDACTVSGAHNFCNK